MITQADLVEAPNGAVLISLRRSGMNLDAETVVGLRDKTLVLSQGGTDFVSVQVGDEQMVKAIQATDDITVVEVDAAGFSFHRKVRKV